VQVFALLCSVSVNACVYVCSRVLVGCWFVASLEYDVALLQAAQKSYTVDDDGSDLPLPADGQRPQGVVATPLTQHESDLAFDAQSVEVTEATGSVPAAAHPASSLAERDHRDPQGPSQPSEGDISAPDKVGRDDSLSNSADAITGSSTAGATTGTATTTAPAVTSIATTTATTATGSTPAAAAVTATGSTPATTTTGSTPATTATGSTPATTATGSSPATTATGSTPATTTSDAATTATGSTPATTTSDAATSTIDAAVSRMTSASTRSIIKSSVSAVGSASRQPETGLVGRHQAGEAGKGKQAVTDSDDKPSSSRAARRFNLTAAASPLGADADIWVSSASRAYSCTVMLVLLIVTEWLLLACGVLVE